MKPDLRRALDLLLPGAARSGFEPHGSVIRRELEDTRCEVTLQRFRFHPGLAPGVMFTWHLEDGSVEQSLTYLGLFSGVHDYLVGSGGDAASFSGDVERWFFAPLSRVAGVHGIVGLFLDGPWLVDDPDRLVQHANAALPHCLRSGREPTMQLLTGLRRRVLDGQLPAHDYEFFINVPQGLSGALTERDRKSLLLT